MKKSLLYYQNIYKNRFRQSKELGKKIVSLSNVFSNKFDNFVNSFDKKNVIYCCQTKNTTSWLSNIGKNIVADYSKIKKKIESANKNISKVSFFHQGIIKYNWQKKKKTRF